MDYVDGRRKMTGKLRSEVLIRGFVSFLNEYYGISSQEIIEMTEEDLFDWYIIWQTSFKESIPKEDRERLVNEAKFIAKKMKYMSRRSSG